MGGIPAGARVGIFAAMAPELRPLVRRLDLRPEASDGGRVFRGRAGDHAVVAAVTSIGTRAAAACASRLLDAEPVEHVCVLGVAGGIAPDLAIGALLDPDAVVDEATGALLHPTSAGVDAPHGLLLTTDRLYSSPADLARLRRAGYAAVDMETAAIGAAAHARGLGWSVFRAISDRAGDPRTDSRVLGLVNPDGTPDLRAALQFALIHPWRIPTLARLGRGMRLAVRASTDALLRALGAT